MKLKGIFSAVCAALLLLTLPACSPAEGSGDDALRIGLLSIDDSLPLFFAEEQGLFEKHGVEVELHPFGSARDKDTALEAGQLDGDMTDLIVASLLQKGGTEVRAVCVALGGTPNEGRFVLLAAPDSGIDDPAKLAGVPVAVGNHTIVHYICDRGLTAADLTRDQIQTQNIPDLSLRYETLLEGSDVKAAVLPDPLAELAIQAGAIPVVDDSRLDRNLSQSVILFTRKAIEEKTDAVDRALAACFEAMEYINEHPEDPAVRDALLRFCSIPEVLGESYPTPSYSPGVLPDEDGVADVQAFLVEQGLLEAPLSYAQLVDDSFVD